MDNSVQRLSPATPTTVMEAPATMSPDHGTQGEPNVDTKSPRETLEQYSYRPDDLPTADTLPEIMVPFQPDKSNLELLPDELLVMTIEALVPIRSSLKYTKDYQAYRASLHSLCLVSRRMDVFARPALYSDIRLYSNARSISLCSTLLTYPQLISHAKSILFFPSHEEMRRDSRTVDLRPLRHLNDPDFAYWTRGKRLAKVQMPETTRDELVYNLLSKVLSRTPALEALYIRLPKHRSPDSHCLFRQKADAACIQQLDLQHQLFEDFSQGSSIPHLSKLKTVGVLGGELDYDSFYDFIPLFQKLLGSPNLVEVFWAQLDPYLVPTHFWEYPLLKDHEQYWPAAPDNFNMMSTSVKRINIQGLRITADEIMGLTIAFPSLESLTVDNECWMNEDAFLGQAWDGQLIFQALGGLENFHTLEFDYAPARFKMDITTASGPAKLVRLSAMSKLRNLVVPVDFFVDFTSDEMPRMQRTTTLLPDSLRHLTLLLNGPCRSRSIEECGIKSGVTLMVTEFFQEVAPALFIEFPHLDKIDLCHHMEHYRQNKVYTLAARSTS